MEHRLVCAFIFLLSASSYVTCIPVPDADDTPTMKEVSVAITSNNDSNYRSASLSPPVKKDLSSVSSSEQDPLELKRQFVLQSPSGIPIITISKAGNRTNQIPNLVVISGPHDNSPQAQILTSVKTTMKNLVERLTNITYPYFHNYNESPPSPVLAAEGTVPVLSENGTAPMVEEDTIISMVNENGPIEDFSDVKASRSPPTPTSLSTSETANTVTLIPQFTVPSFTVPSVSLAMNMRPINEFINYNMGQYTIAQISQLLNSNSQASVSELFESNFYSRPEQTNLDPEPVTQNMQAQLLKLLGLISSLIVEQIKSDTIPDPIPAAGSKFTPFPLPTDASGEHLNPATVFIGTPEDAIPFHADSTGSGAPLDPAAILMGISKNTRPFHTEIPVLSMGDQVSPNKTDSILGKMGLENIDNEVTKKAEKKLGSEHKPTKPRPVYGFQAPEYKPKPSPGEKINELINEVYRIVLDTYGVTRQGYSNA